MKPTPRQTWNRPPLRSLQKAPVKTESWWIGKTRTELQAEATKRHPSGVGAPYRRVER